MQTKGDSVWEMHPIFSKISFIFSVTVISIFYLPTDDTTVPLNYKLRNWWFVTG